MDKPNWLQVESLTTCEVAPDGSSVKLNVPDAESKPKIVLHALRHATGDSKSLRLVHGAENWKIERASDPDYAILTFATPDHCELSFAIRDSTLAQMAELMSEFHVEAFPEGLQFH